MPFSFAGAGAGAQGALRQQQQDASTLENQLAEREYKRQQILAEQARQQQVTQQFQATQQDRQQHQQAIDAAAAGAPSPYIGTLIKAGLVNGAELMPKQPTPHEEWLMRNETPTYGTPQAGDLPYNKPTASSEPQPQIFYDDQNKPHAIQFVGGQAKEIPMPPGMVGKTEPKPAADVKLPVREQDAVVSIHQMTPIVNQVLKSAQDRITAKGGPSGTGGQLIERMKREVQNRGYQLGIANPSADVDQRIQLASLLKIVGTQPWMQGTRNYRFIQDIQQHLADPSATDESIVERLKTLQTQLPELEQAIYDVQNKGVIPHAHTGAMAGSGGGTVRMKAPNGQIKDVSADQVDFYKSRGAVPVQ